jgi:hypothetical protein
MNWKGFGKSRRSLIYCTFFWNLPGGTEANHEKSQSSRSPGRDLNRRPDEYEAGVLTTQPRRSV